jgi:hypothetical protein
MVTLLRAITTSPIYPEVRKRIARPEPDDVWHESALGWVVSFSCGGPSEEAIVLFVIGHVVDRKKGKLQKAFVVRRDDTRVSSAVIFRKEE